jgi:hypothetical protein
MTHRPARGRIQLFPPARFPVYGLASSFPGPRWLELFGDPPDGSPTWVSLGHQSADGRSQIQVTTYVRRARGNPRGYQVPTDAQAAEQGRSALEDVAWHGATGLTNMTLPVSLPRPPGFLRALADRAVAAASAYSAWPVVGWQVDDVPVQVRVWRFAGGWTAVTDAAAGVYLCVVGVGPGTGQEGLSLATLRDSSAYHFDLHEPLSLELVKASAETAGVRLGSPPTWVREDWHPDQLQLIRELGPS